MKKNVLLLSALNWLLIIGCVEEDTFIDDPYVEIPPETPSGLVYTAVTNAREYYKIVSAPPTFNSHGMIPRFEIVDVKDGDGNVLDDTYLSHVSIKDTTRGVELLSEEQWFVDYKGDSIKEVSGIDFANLGTITIANDNNFSSGYYTISVKVSTQVDDNVFSQIFEDVFSLQVGPQIASDLLYIPTAQNLIIGQGNKTTKPLIFNANSEVTYQLANYRDTLTIDSSTGEIAVNTNYISITGTDEFLPTVNVISNISGEVVVFREALQLWVSNYPVVIPKDTIRLFYPTLQAESTVYGYQVVVKEVGYLAAPWYRIAPNIATAADRPPGNTNQKSLKVEIKSKENTNNALPHTSWMIVNSVDLTKYKLGFNLESIFYVHNQYVEYLPDGKTPTELGIYISTDFTDNFDAATWTRVDGEVRSRIYENEEYSEKLAFDGLPYPGDQKGDDPDGRKDVTRNADGKWVKCTLDLEGYKESDKFTLAFKFISNFDSEITYVNGHSRAGIQTIADVHFMAYER